VGFLSHKFEAEILLSENASVFLHDQDPEETFAGRCQKAPMITLPAE
jgi:hypothetical protein